MNIILLIFTLFCKFLIITASDCQFPPDLFNECGVINNFANPPVELKKLHPWHVAIYKKRNNGNSVPINTCGGTLVSQNVLITAAHCLADDAGGALRNINDYLVAGGNDYREFDDARDKEFRQIRQIKKVILPRNYRGHGSAFIGDIAMVVVDQPFTLSPVVQPACIGGLTNTQLTDNSVGVSVGWGLTTASRDPNTRLSRLTVPFVNLKSCTQSVSNEFIKYLQNDKFCGIFKDGFSICATDNGGGILFEENDSNGVPRLYLHGVASVGLISQGSCESTQYSAFTSLKPYLSDLCEAINS